jgi:DNA primase
MTFLDYQLARAKRFYDLQTPIGRADCVSRILPLLEKVDDQVERWGYVTLLAEKVGVPVELLQRQMAARNPKEAVISQSAAPLPIHQTSALPRVEYDLLRLLLHDVSIVEQVQQHITLDDFREPVLRDIYAVLLRQELRGRQSLFPMILDYVETAAQRQLLAKMAAEPMNLDIQECRKALDDYLLHFKRRSVQTRLRRLRECIREAERRGDAAGQQRLLQEYTTLSRER